MALKRVFSIYLPILFALFLNFFQEHRRLRSMSVKHQIKSSWVVESPGESHSLSLMLESHVALGSAKFVQCK